MKEICSQFIVGIYDFQWSADLRSFLKNYPVHGLALFNSPWDSPDHIWENKEASLDAIYDLYSGLNSQKHFLAVDQEGGRVRRFRGHYINLPPARTIGNYFQQTKDIGTIEQLYTIVAKQLVYSGVSLNFAPVVDRLYPESSEVVGDRAFSHDPDVIETLAQIVLKVFQNENLASTLKHFPGHGATKYDSHQKTATLFKEEHELKRDEQIFAHLASDASGMMTAHIAYPEDPKTIISLSKERLSAYRKKYHNINPELFWVTDDLLQMKAVSDQSPWIKTWEAGYDYLLLCGKLDDAANAIEETIRYVSQLHLGFQEKQNAIKRAEKAQSRFSGLSSKEKAPKKGWKNKIIQLQQEAEHLLERIHPNESNA